MKITAAENLHGSIPHSCAQLCEQTVLAELITPGTMLSFVQHAIQLIDDQLEQFLEHGPTSSLKEDFNGHTEPQCGAVEIVTLATQQINFQPYQNQAFIS